MTKNFNTSWMFELDEVNPYAYVHNFLNPKECNSIIEHGKKYKLEPGLVNKQKKNKIRESTIKWLYPHDDIIWLYERLSRAIVDLNNRYFKFDISGLTEGLQFTTYKHPDGRYGKHVDLLFNGTIRKLSISVQLTDPKKYTGGDLCLYTSEKPVSLPRSQGSLYIFPSYILHEVKPVTKGERQSLVAWVNGKAFK